MKKQLKLKGVNSKKLKPDQKKKMEATLKVMQENREKDGCWLRTKIEAKLDWAKAEREKGINAIKNLQKQVLQLNGAITVLQELLVVKNAEKAGENK